MRLGLRLDESKRMWFRLLFADESSLVYMFIPL